MLIEISDFQDCGMLFSGSCEGSMFPALPVDSPAHDHTVLENNDHFSALVHIRTAARSIKLVLGFWKRERLWLCDFKTKVVFVFLHVHALYCRKKAVVEKTGVTTVWVFLGAPCVFTIAVNIVL